MRLSIVTKKTDDLKTESPNPNYIELVEAFGEDRILERREYLYVVAADLIQRLQFKPEDFFLFHQL